MENKELFTGERFIPGIDDSKLEIEHYQRYLSVRNLVKDKVILDAACGEGYGSNMLASSARQVTGIDIDKETIERARKTYASCGNLQFMQGSIERLPIADGSVDAIISFETIEHVSEETQKKFLEEIKRVLKKDGFLVMSTPNKRIYSDLHNYKNEFHIKEFYHDEFVDFLKSKFQYVQMFNQAFQVTSVLTKCQEVDGEIAFYSKEKEYNQEGKYYIAVASDVNVDAESLASVYLNHSGEYEENIARIVELQNAEEERNQQIRKLDEEASNAGKMIRRLQREEEERNNHIKALDGMIEEKDREIQCKSETISAQTEMISALKVQMAQLKEREEQLKEQEESLKEREEQLKEQEESLKEREGQLKEWEERLKEQEGNETEKAAIIKQQLDMKEAQINSLQQTIRNKEGHIELLLEVERAYEREKKSRSYRFAKGIQRIVDFLLPPDSRRRFFLRILLHAFRHPILMFHVMKPRRIKNYFICMRQEGMAGVRKRYQQAVEMERTYMNPASQLDLELVEEVPKKGKTKELKIEDFEKIVLPVWDEPKVSIVIPVYNEFQYTYNCVKSIVKNSGNVSYEVIIANDCSTDITQEIEKAVENVRIITTKKNVRFLLNCNNAAKYAKGKYILFLNNDTQVQENWLSPLVSLIERDQKIGMVGSKLIYPDGLLQEAGGIVWKDASAWNFGNRKNTEDPEYNYVKEADYISGAAIMIRKELWEEIGGFDERFVPAYYEDTDLAFEVRKRGYKVMYQPLSRVVHFEGVSNGTDVQTGLKHYQQVNFERFYEKWKDVLEAEQEANGENVFTAKDRSNHKKHMLVVDHYVPHHDQDAGGKCTFMYLQTFVRMGFQVTFIGDNFYRHEPYTTELNQMGIEVLYGNYYYNNWQEWLKENGHYFDYIYLQRPHISIKYIDLVKQYSQAKIFYFAHDLHHIREYREYEMTKDPEKLASSQKWKEIEYELFEKADVGHVVGSFEQEKMQEVFPDKPIRNIPLYIYEENLTDINKDFATRNDILFVGGFGHSPNIDAVLWFAKDVYPRVLQKYPNMKWHVVGSKVPLKVQELASDNILIEGFLSDEALDKLYRECRLAVVPLRYGAGVKGKVVESAYYQIPLITTSIGAEGLSREEQFMVVEDDAAKMAEIICELYENYQELRAMSDNGIKFIQNHFTLQEAERVLRLDIDI